ncbi:MAG: class I tRNA ligase family protein [Thermoplasmata archaeon]|nr:class I tRNA ligase family protein [Thermoplasmata archaeon]
MRALSAALDARAVEAQTREFWSGRGLPPGPADRPDRGGPPIHLSIGGLPPLGGIPLAALHRGVLADVATRAQLLLERTATGPVLFGSRPAEEVPSSAPELWEGLGLWFGRGAMEPVVRSDLHSSVDRMLGRLAETNVLVAKEGPLRWCPRCQQPRDPASILYVDEEGPAYLVRFALRDVQPRVDALVWTDAAWKLLGTTAVLLNPKLVYVLAKFSRRGSEERVLTSRSSLERLRAWLPDSEIEILEERPGSGWAGTPYVHPLAEEYPPLHSLLPPGGQFHPSAEVGDSGTGIVTLTPAHGASDARIAEALEIPGWPVLSPNGLLEGQSAHKYQGLPMDTAEAFILRDLTDSALIFAQLRVRHGVPRCGECASGLFWRPGRAWRLEPDRIDPETLSLFGRLLPREPLPVASEVVPWPVSDTRPTTDAAFPSLEECSDCSRLAPTGTGPQCPCGGIRTEVRRPLLPIFAEAIYRWARLNPFPQDNGVSLFMPEQRRGPVLLTHLVGQFAAMARPAETHLTLLPTGSVEADDARPDPGAPVDAVRSALVRMAARPRATSPLTAVIAEETRRLRRFWAVASRLSEALARDSFGLGDQSIAQIRDSLPPEDRAFVSRFERLRADALAGLAAGRFPDTLGRISRFAEHELRERFLLLARSRLEESGPTTGKSMAHGVLLHVIIGLAELWAPFAPFAMEAIHRTFRDDARSLFESPLAPVRQSLVDPASEKLLDLVSPVAQAIERARRRLGVPRSARWASLVVNARDEAAANELRELLPVLTRVLPVAGIEIASPAHPWEGRQIRAEPNLAELQRVYRASAGRVATLLTQMPGKRVKEGLRNQTLNVVLGGSAVQILPSMVGLTDTLPPRVLVLSYPKGDLYLQLPEGIDSAVSDRMLGLSPEAYRLVRAVRRRLSRAPADANVTEAWVEVPPALEEELRTHAVAIAQSLRIPRFEAQATGTRFISGETTWGRTALGTRWRVWVPGLPRPVGRRKLRASRRLGRRARRAVRFEQLDEVGIDFLSEDVRNREASVRATLEQLDVALGVPFLGPAKLEAAWEAGYRDVDSLSRASYEALVPIPGFGPYVAREVVRRYGGAVPDRIWVWPPIHVTLPEPEPALLPETAAPELRPDIMALEPPAGTGPPAAPAGNGPLAPLTSSPPPPRRPALRVVAPQPPPPLAPTPAPEIVPLPPWRPPVPVDAAASQASAALQVSTRPGIELLVEDTTDTAWNQFLEAVSAGRRGLCVTREFPDRLRRRIGTRDITVIWLSNVGRQNSVKPSDVGALGTLFVSALGEGHVSAVLLEGFEYLVTVNTLAPVLKLLRELHARAQTVGTPVWVPVNPRLLTPAEVEMLQGAFPGVSH